MTASRGVDNLHPDEHRAPRLDAVPGFGRSIAQPPWQLPVVEEHKGMKSSANAWMRSKNKNLRRRQAEQRVNALIRRGMSPPKDLVEMATRPGRK